MAQRAGSGSIRKLIGPSRARLVRNLEESSTDLPQFDLDQQNVAEIRKALVEKKYATINSIAKLEQGITYLNEKHVEWTNVLENLADDEETLTKEQKIYEEMIKSPEGFVAVASSAEEKVNDLRTFLLEIEDTLECLQNPSSNVALGTKVTPAFTAPAPKPSIFATTAVRVWSGHI